MNNDLVPQIASGIAMGGLYGLVAMSIVFTYRSTYVLNFAQGEMAMLGTYIYWTISQFIPIWFAIFLTLILSFFMGTLLERLLLRRLDKNNPSSSLVLTIGLLMVINSTVQWWYGPIQKSVPSPFGSGVIRLASYNFSLHAIGTILMVLLAVAILIILFKFTQLGLALRATAENWRAAQLMGIPVDSMLNLGWAISAVLGTVAGILVAPILVLVPSMMQPVMMYAYSGAVIGGLESPVGALAGGILIGVVENLAGTWSPIGSDLKIVIAFALTFVVLSIFPNGLFAKREARLY